MRRFLKNIPFLYKWLLFGFLVLASAIGFMYGLLLPRLEASYLDGLARKGRALSRSIAPQAGAALYFQQIARLGDLLESVTSDEDLAFLQVRDLRNRRMYGYRDLPYRQAVDEFLKYSSEFRNAAHLLYLRQSIFYHNQFEGLLVIGLNKTWIETQMDRLRWLTGAFVGGMGFLFLLGLLLLHRDAILPLRELTRAVRFLAAEEPGQRLNLSVSGADELGTLADKIRVLSLSLERNFRELNQSKKYIEAFFRLSPIPMLITDPMGRIEDANESAARFFETSRENLLNKNLEMFLSADVNVVLNRVLKTTPDLKNYITSITTPRGSKRVIEINLSILHDQYQMPKNLIVALVDITEKIQTQREILENQTKLHRMNRELVQKTRELQQAIDHNRRNAGKLARLIEISQELLRHGSGEEIVRTLLTGGFSLVEADQAAIYLWDRNQKQLVPRLAYPEQERERFQPLSENTSVLWQTFQTEQPHLVQLDALEPADLQALNLDGVAELSLIVVPIAEKSLKFGAALFLKPHKYAFGTEDLHLLTTLAHLAAITLDKIYLLQALRDKAQHLEKAYQDLQKSQQQVVQLQKMESLGTLVGGIAHDFNNILGIILPNIDLIRLKVDDENPIVKHINTIQEAAERAADLTRQLLMFSRNQDVNLQPISPNQLIMRLSGMFRRTLGKHIEVRTELDTNVPYIRADETRLTQVLINLAVNSRDAMPNGGVLTFRTRLVNYKPSSADPQEKPRPMVCIAVADTGVGIPRDHLDKIFDPFFTTKSVGQGTGLGLSVVYGIVKSHNGLLEVESEEGRGTVFRLYFESVKVAQPRPVHRKLTGIPEGNEVVLVVDDEEMIRDSLRDILQSLGYSVLLAGDGPQAVEIARQHSEIQLAIVDFAMPQWNGIVTIKHLREVNPAMRILLSSGHADREHLLDANVPVEGFLPKPYRISELARKIKEVLRKPVLSRN